MLAAEIPLGGQHGHVTKQELNLFQFTAIHMAKPSARPAKIRRPAGESARAMVYAPPPVAFAAVDARRPSGLDISA